MEHLFALLTAVCLWMLWRDLTRGRRRILAQTGGGLLLRVRRTYVLGAGCELHFLCLISGIAVFLLGDPAMLFICAGALLWAVEGAFHPRNYVELRQRGMILALRGRTALVPWRFVLWEKRRGRLLMELPDRRERCSLLFPEQVNALMEELVSRGEVRDASRGVIAATIDAQRPKAADGDDNDAKQAGKESDKVVFARFQFTLRTLFIAVFTASAAASWVGVRYRRSQDPQHIALAQLESFQPDVSWLNQEVVGLDLCGSPSKPADKDLEPLIQLRGLRFLNLDGANVTGAGLVHLRNLEQLEFLSLRGTSITDAGLVHLKNLTELESLHLSHTRVTDAGLLHLHELTNLKFVFLFGTTVTDQGVADLRRALPGVEVIR